MSTMLASSVLVFMFFLLLGLPLLPALRELICRTDSAPLQVVQQHAGDVRFFADVFRQYLASIQPKLDEPEFRGLTTQIVMPDGTLCLVLPQHAASRDFGIDRKRTCAKLIVLLGDALLPVATTFEKEVYARGSLWGGAGNYHRALLGESDVHLAEETVVMRWAHAVGEMDCAPRCRLYGRLTSERSIRLHAGCCFTRVNAPCIAIGAQISNLYSSVPAAGATEIVARILHEGDLQVAPGEIFAKNLVVRGEVRIGAGAQMLGNVKAQKATFVEPGVIVHGSLISAEDLKIGPGCCLLGPVIAEHAIAIGRETRVGSLEAPTTLSAPKIEIAEGAMVYGTLWARNQGQVVVDS